MSGFTVQNLVPQGFVHPYYRSYPNWAAKPMGVDQIRYTEFEVFVICFIICIFIYSRLLLFVWYSALHFYLVSVETRWHRMGLNHWRKLWCGRRRLWRSLRHYPDSLQGLRKIMKSFPAWVACFRAWTQNLGNTKLDIFGMEWDERSTWMVMIWKEVSVAYFKGYSLLKFYCREWGRPLKVSVRSPVI
jgi:hypothetical protein